jgi:hypothetical protein
MPQPWTSAISLLVLTIKILFMSEMVGGVTLPIIIINFTSASSRSFTQQIEFLHFFERPGNFHNALFRIIWRALATSSRIIRKILTGADGYPNEVHEKIIEPKVIPLRPAEQFSVFIEIEQTGGVIENISIYLTNRNEELEGMACGMLHGDAIRDEKGERAPAKLSRNVVNSCLLSL